MSQQYLLEIGLEEVPARFLLSLRDQLAERMTDFLDEHRIEFNSVDTFATPRRLAVRVNGLPDKQADLSEAVRGPSLKIAQDDSGQWTKAAEGFSRGQGGSVEDLVVREDNGEPYIYIDKFQSGLPVAEILPQVREVLEAMTFPVRMTWGSHHDSFIRPVHWLVSLLEDQVIPFNFIDASADRISRGHRFLGDDATIDHPAHYEDLLEEQFVLVDFERRKQRIEEQVNQIATDNDWLIPIDEGLLEEVTALVEWPTAFYGDFEEKYLEVPSIVLQTAMRDHQRYFYVLDPQSQQMKPFFVSVRNGNDQHLANVVKGNQKVLRARLEDALFFYQEDQKRPLEDFVNQLANVNEHYEIGSLEDKQERVVELLELLESLFDESNLEAMTVAKEAAAIYKFDLMTLMVNEFAELQGQMGAIYATHYGLSDEIAQAIGEQYLPTHSHGELPQSLSGALLAFSDKLDTLMEYFKIGLIPTGSQDPFALRRQAMGIVEIILDQDWFFDLQVLWVDWLHLDDEVVVQLRQFIQARLSQYLQDREIDYDIIQAVLLAPHLNLVKKVANAYALQELKDETPERYAQLLEAITRVVNLGSKVTQRLDFIKDLAQTASEEELIELVEQLPHTEDAKQRLASLVELMQPISLYFEENMVHADDEAIRNNRLATMQALTYYIFDTADPRELISKFK